MANTMKIAFIGFGEAAQAFTRGWRAAGLAQPLALAAYDILLDGDPQIQGQLFDHWG